VDTVFRRRNILKEKKIDAQTYYFFGLLSMSHCGFTVKVHFAIFGKLRFFFLFQSKHVLLPPFIHSFNKHPSCTYCARDIRDRAINREGFCPHGSGSLCWVRPPGAGKVPEGAVGLGGGQGRFLGPGHLPQLQS
jgi:hypothetical protein